MDKINVIGKKLLVNMAKPMNMPNTILPYQLINIDEENFGE